jgi:uracil-DNA glycosylase family 4
MEALNQAIRKCNRCRLSETRINALCGEGNPNAKLMLIAQAPGEKEDREGRMFIGPSGKVLEELLTAANIDREEIYMTNLIKCMLPKYRKPKSDEIEICSRYLDCEIELINPEVLVPLGYYAARYIFDKYGISLPPKPEIHKIYGEFFGAGNRKILPLRHPAALLYHSSIREEIMGNYVKMKMLLGD